MRDSRANEFRALSRRLSIDRYVVFIAYRVESRRDLGTRIKERDEGPCLSPQRFIRDGSSYKASRKIQMEAQIFTKQRVSFKIQSKAPNGAVFHLRQFSTYCISR